jgi:hypothetical protein
VGKTYTVTLTEEQLAILTHAAEVVSRLAMGQLEMAIEDTPLKEKYWEGDWHADKNTIECILRKYWKHPLSTCRNAFFGISNDEIPESIKILFDVYQVFRHRLSWDHSIERGEALSDGVPVSGLGMGVWHHTPMKVANVPLAKIESL